ncbi:hypothetical protein ACSQ67_017174 [Phaseolus vulgaris]
MRKRERENPCGVCGHYHKYEEGEVCSICGHRIPVGSEKTSIQVSAFPSVILPEFLYLGSYDNASRSELLKTQGISRILNVWAQQSPSLDGLIAHMIFLVWKIWWKAVLHLKPAYPNFLSVYFFVTPSNNLFLQTVPSCQNLYKNSFIYHCLPDDKTLPFDEAIQFLARDLVGDNRYRASTRERAVVGACVKPWGFEAGLGVEEKV